MGGGGDASGGGGKMGLRAQAARQSGYAGVARMANRVRGCVAYPHVLAEGALALGMVLLRLCRGM